MEKKYFLLKVAIVGGHLDLHPPSKISKGMHPSIPPIIAAPGQQVSISSRINSVHFMIEYISIAWLF